MMRSNSSGSTLPPDRVITTGGSKAPGSASTAAMPAAPDGSTTSLLRSRQVRTARAICSSSTVTISIPACWMIENGREPGLATAIPSAIVFISSKGTGRPAFRDGG